MEPNDKMECNGVIYEKYIIETSDTMEAIKTMEDDDILGINDTVGIDLTIGIDHTVGLKAATEEDDRCTRALMFSAARAGDQDTIKRLLQQGQSLEEKDAEGQTAFYLACKHGRLELAKFLLTEATSTMTATGNESATSPAGDESADLESHETALDADGDAEPTLLSNRLVVRLAADVGAGTSASDTASAPRNVHLLHLANKRRQTPLYVAANKNHKKVVEFLLDSGAEINEPNQDGDTPLITAAERGRRGIVKLLVQRGATLNTKSVAGRTALYSAARHGHSDVAEFLISEAVDLNTRTDRGRTPLYAAIDHGHLAVARLLIQKGADVDISTTGNWRPLHRACVLGHEDIVRLLLSKQADVNAAVRTDGLYTPLTLAAGRARVGLVKLLLDAGADSEPVGASDTTALIQAVKSGNTQKVKVLLDKTPNVNHPKEKGKRLLKTVDFDFEHPDITKLFGDEGAQLAKVDHTHWLALYIAALSGSAESAKFLLEKGVDPDISTENGWTALLAATGQGHVDVVKLLLEKDGTALDQKTEDYWNPLLVAARFGYKDIVKMLLDRGADIEVSRNGSTPLSQACEMNQVEIAEMLIDAGASLERASKGFGPLYLAAEANFVALTRLLANKGANLDAIHRKWTPLAVASKRGYLEVVEILADTGADLDLKGDHGWAALSLAARAGHFHIVKLLLSKGADPCTTTSVGETPLHHATIKGHPEIVKELLTAGIEPAAMDSADKDGHTALHVAADKGHCDIVKLLVQAGASSKVAAKNGRLPLHMASSSGYLEVVKYFLEDCPEQFHAADCNGFTPLHLASKSGNVELIQYLLNYDVFTIVSVDAVASVDPVIEAEDHLEVNVLMNDPNIQNKMGWTPLHSAANAGRVDVLKHLLENEVDLTIPDASGRTPLLSASFYGHEEVVNLLLEQPTCDPLAVDAAGRNALFIAASQGHFEIVKKLLALPNLESSALLKKDVYNSTPLCAAMRNGYHRTAAELLKANRPPLDAKDFRGKTLAAWVRRFANRQLKDLFLDDEWHGGAEDSVASRARTMCATCCHVCMKLVAKKHTRYRCGVCQGGYFTVCMECIAHSMKCPYKSHELIEVTQCIIH